MSSQDRDDAVIDLNHETLDDWHKKCACLPKDCGPLALEQMGKDPNSKANYYKCAKCGQCWGEAGDYLSPGCWIGDRWPEKCPD
jgi:hypothetical protein